MRKNRPRSTPDQQEKILEKQPRMFDWKKLRSDPNMKAPEVNFNQAHFYRTSFIALGLHDRRENFPCRSSNSDYLNAYNE